MLAGPQFEQLSLFHAPKEAPAGAAEQRNRAVPKGGQYELPIREDLGHPAAAPEPQKRTREERVMGGEHPVGVHHGGTYPMLMAAHEIRSQFQALDGDRNDGPSSGDLGSGSSNNPRMTIRGSFTATRTQRDQRVNVAAQHGITTGAGTWHAGEHVSRLRKRLSDLPESDEELYDRKYEEANESKRNSYGESLPSSSQRRGSNSDSNNYGSSRSSSGPSSSALRTDGDLTTHGAGLAQKIASHGYDLQHPVSLATGLGRDTGWSNSAGLGRFGKHQVLGGHHRVAVMGRDRPNELLSVQWHGNIDEAANSKSY